MASWDGTLARIDADEASERAAARFGATGPVLPVSTGANLIFRFPGPGGAVRYLRLIHAALRDRDEVEQSTRFQAHLVAGGAPVAPLVRSAAGALVETLDVGDEPVVATAVEAVPGRAVEPVPAEYSAFGRALAALHRASEDYEPPQPPRRHWEREWRECLAMLPPDDSAARAEGRRVDTWLKDLPRDERSMGMTHADCNRTNALFDGERVHIIDFDEPTWHWFAADVARPWRELTPERGDYDGCLAAFVAGYREVRSLEERWVAAIPGFVRMKNVEIYAWDSGTENWSGDVLPGGRDRRTVIDAIRRSFASEDGRA